MSAADRPRILYLIRTLSGAGAELVVESLCRGIDRTRFDVSVCELSGHGEKADNLQRSGFAVYSLDPTGNLKSPLRRICRLRQLVRRLGIDVIHSHSTDAMADGALCGLTVPGLRHVHTFHFGNYPNHSRTHLLLERVFNRFVDQLVAVGHAQADSIRRTYGIDAARIHVVWNGIESRPARIDRVKLDGLGLDGKVVIATIGTLIEQKGHIDLIEVADEFRRRKQPAVFLIVGGGALRQDLELRVRDRQLQETVIFLGWIKDAAETVLPAADIFFQPSRWEAMSMVLLEAAAAGKAIVCTSVGEASRIIRNGESGYVVPPRDTVAMTESLLKLVQDPVQRKMFGEKAQRDVRQCCMADAMIANYESLYARVLGRTSVIPTIDGQ